MSMLSVITNQIMLSVVAPFKQGHWNFWSLHALDAHMIVNIQERLKDIPDNINHLQITHAAQKPNEANLK